jgi:hypothetical protein
MDTEAILAQIAKPGPLVEPLNLKEKCQENKDDENVYRTVHVPLYGWIPTPGGVEKSPITPYRLGASAWKDYMQGTSVNPFVFILQLMMLLVESTSLEGGFVCGHNADTQPGEYHDTCVAMAKTLKGTAKKADWQRRSKYVLCTHEVDLQFAHDVAHEKKVIEEAQKRERKKKTKKRSKKRTKVSTYQLFKDRLVACGFPADYQPSNIFGDQFELIGDKEELEAEEVEEQEEEEEGEESALVKEPYLGPAGRMDKISMSITEIPHANDRNTIIGMMITFVIRDPSINPGLFYKDCMDNLAARGLRKQRFSSTVHKPEMFSEYDDFMMSFLPAGNRTNLQTYAQCVTKCYPYFVEHYYKGNERDFMSRLEIEGDTPAHIYNLFTAELAIRHLKDAGGCPLVLGEAINWVDRARGIVHYPQDVRTWKPSQIGTIWFNKKNAGFSNHYFPFVDTKSDFLRALCSGVQMREFLSGASDESAVKKSTLDTMLSESILVLKSEISKRRDLGYETNNEFIYATFESDLIYSFVNEYYPEAHYHDTLKEVQALVKTNGMRWRLLMTPDLAKRVEECELYNTILNTSQEAMRKTFYNILPLDENPDLLKVSKPLKDMIRWYQDNHENKLPSMSRPYQCIDPELDPFGNTMVQQLFIFTRFAKVLQPMICILSEGLFSCYDAFQTELSYNQMIYGRFDVGKTHTAINILIGFSTIPGTITEQPLATKASDTTHKHCHDEIIATDECPEWIVSEIEAKKNPDLVNKEKVKMTRGRLVQKTFVWIDLPNGRKLRWNEDIVTDHKKALVLVSNHPPDSKKALSSRFHRFIMKKPKISPSEMKGYVDENLKNDTKLYLHINQFLSALSKKMAACGGIRPEVEMELFDDISTRVINYLKATNSISHESGPRSLEIMKPFLRQLIYKMAIRYAFDFEWSDNYDQKFSLEQLAAIQPFLYATVSQVWFVWTACASEWINDDYCNVLRAMIQEACPEWIEGQTNAYTVYENDVHSKVKFKMSVNDIPTPNAKMGEEAAQDKFIININYMCLEGTEDMIAQRVAQHTNPPLEPDQIKTIFKRLSEIQKRPEDGGFAPQKMGTFAKWHKYLRDDEHATKFTQNDAPDEYVIETQNKREERRQGDVPKLPEGTTLPIVDRSDLRKNKLYFIPGMERYFQQDIILAALRYATYCQSTRLGKYLLGFPMRENTTRLDVEVVDRPDLEKYMTTYDEESGFERQRDSSWKSANPNAVSRRDGVVYNRRAAFSNFDVVIASSIQFVPHKKGDDTWQTTQQNGAKAMSKDREIVYDLDVRSAERQHMRCGRPLDEPVRTPQWIMQETGNRSLNRDYPYEDIDEKDSLEQKWTETVVMGKKEADLMKLFSSKKVSRKQRQQQIALQQAAQVQHAVGGIRRAGPPIQKRGREKVNDQVERLLSTTRNNENLY